MKKIWSLVIVLSLVFAIFSPIADVKRPPVPTPFPNISSKAVAQKVKSGTYNYYGVKLGNSFATVKKQWVHLLLRKFIVRQSLFLNTTMVL